MPKCGFFSVGFREEDTGAMCRSKSMYFLLNAPVDTQNTEMTFQRKHFQQIGYTFFVDVLTKLKKCISFSGKIILPQIFHLFKVFFWTFRMQVSQNVLLCSPKSGWFSVDFPKEETEVICLANWMFFYLMLLWIRKMQK